MSHNLDNPSTRWFFNDWDNEPGMKFCSLAAQGLWFKMLGLAARSREYGVVLIGDHPSLRTDLPALLAPSCGETVETIGKLVDDLITFKVAAVESGRVINRRMVREAKEETDRIALSAARAAAGRAGAERRWQTDGKPQKRLGKPMAKSSGKPMAKSGSGVPAENGDQQVTLAIAPADQVRQSGSKKNGKNGSSSSSFFLSSVSKDTGAGAPVDKAKVTFGACLAYLVENGRDERSARSLLGKWRKNHGDDAVHVAVDKARARAAGTSDPVPYIQACLKSGAGRASPGRPTTLFEAQP